MKIIEWSEFLKDGMPLEGKLSSMTVGVFDGVHRGHQALIERIVSHNTDYIPVIVTFRENHKTGDTESEDIQTFQEKITMFEKFGIQITVVVDFTESFRHLPGLEFLELLLKHGNIGFFAAGSDFRCGYKLDTNSANIQKFFTSHAVPAEVVPEVMEGSLPVSSSRIRAALAAGDSELAKLMLGR